jgi:hypothetical protein
LLAQRVLAAQQRSRHLGLGNLLAVRRVAARVEPLIHFCLLVGLQHKPEIMGTRIPPMMREDIYYGNQ